MRPAAAVQLAVRLFKTLAEVEDGVAYPIQRGDLDLVILQDLKRGRNPKRVLLTQRPEPFHSCDRRD